MIEKKFTVTKVEPIPKAGNSAEGGWRIEFDTPEGWKWSELPNSKCAVAPQVGEEAVFIFPKGRDHGSVMVGGRLYIDAYPPEGR